MTAAFLIQIAAVIYYFNLIVFGLENILIFYFKIPI